MKTFKLISLQIVEEDQLVDIPLVDGLIINKEDDQNSWLLEAYTDLTHHDFFQAAYDSQEDLIVQVVISKKENDPAAFQTKVCTVKEMDGHLSILFQGKLKRSKSDYAELLLGNLLNKGISGDALLMEFKEKMKTKPRIEEIRKAQAP